MKSSSILILVFIVFGLISYYLYYNVFDLLYNNKIHPLIEDYKKNFNRKNRSIEKQVVWTYIEDPIFFDQDYYLQLLEKKKNVPILFNFCLQILNSKINRDVNSYHDFGIESVEVPKCFQINAKYKNSVEQIIHENKKMLGIMWHPEREDKFSKLDIKLFRKFLNIK